MTIAREILDTLLRFFAHFQSVTGNLLKGDAICGQIFSQRELLWLMKKISKLYC